MRLLTTAPPPLRGRKAFGDDAQRGDAPAPADGGDELEGADVGRRAEDPRVAGEVQRADPRGDPASIVGEPAASR